MRRKCVCAQIMRHRRVLCANAYSAQTMRRCAFGLYDARIRILRILCADAQMRLCAYYAHIICRCAYYADMLILCAYYPYMFILFVLQIKHSPPLLTYTDPPRWWEGVPAPALIHCKLVRLGANTFPLGSMCAAAQNAQRQSQSRESQKRIIFRRILEQEGETSKNQ